MKALLKELNEPQRKAVVDYNGPSLVIAGAGSGKTRVLTYRIAYMLSEGIHPASILALTFTNKAATEMKERIASLVGSESARRLWMGTFHSVFARILRYESEATGYPSNYTIYDTIDSKSLVKTIIKEMNLDDNVYKPGEIFGRISTAKNNLVTPEVYASSTDILARDHSTKRPMISEIYKRYVNRCKLAGAMDFDDLLLNTNILFRDHPLILNKYQNAFNYILVDEYQDTNYSQYLIINKLSLKHRNICVVGDDAQSIYSFRGARIENILSFRNDYEGVKLFKLEQNYRSTRMIVEAANSIISQNKEQISKKVFSEKDTGDKITVIEARTDNEEGFIVASQIKDKLFARQMQYRDFAILYRTNAQSRIFEESLRKLNIPYRVYGGLSFFQRKEIKDVLAYFKFTVNPSDDEAFKRIINYPHRGLGKTTLSRLEELASRHALPLWKVIDNESLMQSVFNKLTILKVYAFRDLIMKFRQKLSEMEAFDIAYTIINEAGILRDLITDKTPEGVSRYENVEELLNGIKEFTETSEGEKIPGLTDYLETVTLYTDADYDKNEDTNKVSIMTVHSAKGLEFKQVFIAGVEEELFPVQMSAMIPKELEEERRLFYVALTRAKESVVITYATSRYRWGQLIHCNPSRFIREIDEKYLDLPHSPESSYLEKTGFRSTREFPPLSQNQKLRPLTVTGRSFPDEKGTDKSFEDAADPSKIMVGLEVEHPRFGKGKVISREGAPPNVKVAVFFRDHGQKQLLLKFAKLRILR